MTGDILPEGYRRLPVWETDCPRGGADAVEARSAETVLAACAQGLAAGDIYFTAPQKSETDIRRIMGKCRIVADSVNELRRIDHAVRDISKAGILEPVGIRLTLSGWDGPGIGTDSLPALSREVRSLSALSVRGCFVQGNIAGLYGGALGRYYRSCYEAAKRMSAVLPCRIAFLCVVGGGETARRNAEEHPETLPEFLRAADIVAAQNRSAFYAGLLVT